MEKNDKKIEEFVDKIMQHDVLEQPPINFTDTIMSKISSVPTSQITTYTPLIPKYVWWLIGVAFTSLVLYIFFGNTESSYSLFDKVTSVLPEGVSFPEFKVFQDMNLMFSETSVYAICFLALMFCVQIPILKNYMSKQLEL